MTRRTPRVTGAPSRRAGSARPSDGQTSCPLRFPPDRPLSPSGSFLACPVFRISFFAFRLSALMRPSLTVFRPVRLAVPALVLAAASARAQRPDTTLEHGASVGVIDVDSMVTPPVGDFSDLLSSRVPGVLVER